MSFTILVIIFSILVLIGFLGVFLPILPGIPYMFLVVFIFALIDKFVHFSWIEILILGIIAIISIFIDYFSGIIGAKYGGATKTALFFGFIGLIIGLVVFPPFGAIIGLFLGVLISELSFHGNHKRAIKSASYSVFGALTGILINLVLAVLFFILFLTFTYR